MYILLISLLNGFCLVFKCLILIVFLNCKWYLSWTFFFCEIYFFLWYCSWSCGATENYLFINFKRFSINFFSLFSLKQKMRFFSFLFPFISSINFNHFFFQNEQKNCMKREKLEEIRRKKWKIFLFSIIFSLFILSNNVIKNKFLFLMY